MPTRRASTISAIVKTTRSHMKLAAVLALLGWLLWGIDGIVALLIAGTVTVIGLA